MNRWLKTIFAVATAMFATTANAQEVMDGSGASYDDEIAKDIALSLADKANDPYSAQIIMLKPSTGSDDVICGFINLRSQTNGYTGFQPFFFNTKSKSISLRESSGCR